MRALMEIIVVVSGTLAIARYVVAFAFRTRRRRNHITELLEDNARLDEFLDNEQARSLRDRGRGRGK